MNTLILLAGGTGSRTGLDTPKQFIEVNGKTLLEICYQEFVNTSIFDFVVVVCDTSYKDLVADICQKFTIPFFIAKAGKERANSVLNGLIQCPDNTIHVAVHDSARANIRSSLINKLYDYCVKEECGVIPGYSDSDSIKLVYDNQIIEKTLNRDLVYKVQTPQIFPYSKILKSYQTGISNDYNGTDCSSYYEQLYTVKIVEGDRSNIKVTYASDLEEIKNLLKL
ncbi:MAG: 2-C-methyl-D-erythritol 4-phosphate cytidylyltransferase [Candidatus Cloacimonetes bacterium]|nr:2-C-methyl-D-erythritol 4-phosphate cytidylyltransferase [Candidatus Cloacimonadota bacterium]